MPRPRLDDDGSAVSLDLHGVGVSEACDLAAALVVEAARRGRSTVRLIYGSSSYDRGDARTIKGEILQALADGDYDRHVASSYATDGALVLGLAPAPRPSSGRLSLADLR